ncbi:MAG: hypothetical protein AAB503_01750 [Patescibacteria group bacterium]
MGSQACLFPFGQIITVKHDFDSTIMPSRDLWPFATVEQNVGFAVLVVLASFCFASLICFISSIDEEPKEKLPFLKVVAVLTLGVILTAVSLYIVYPGSGGEIFLAICLGIPLGFFGLTLCLMIVTSDHSRGVC